MRQSANWLLRGVVIVVVAAVIALWVLVHPLPEPSHPTASPQPSPSPAATPTPRPTPVPTATPTPSPVPSATATPTRQATATATATLSTSADYVLAGRVEQQAYFSPTTGAEETYRIYLPPGYDQSDRRYPVLYLLHGWPYQAAHWDGLGIEEAADSAIQSGALPPSIIVQPRGSERMYVNTSGGEQSFEGQVINDLIPHVDATFRTWAEREGRAIGGISRGGVWSLEIGFSHPGVFAAVGAHSPALSVNLAPPVHDPFYLLEEPGVAGLRIYLDAGDVDWTREYTQKLHAALDEHGIHNEFTVHDGGHAAGMWAAHVAEYLAFYTAGWAGPQ